MWTEYVIDVTMGERGGLLCFCPVERGFDGEIESIVTGMNYLSDAPPSGSKVVGVIHADGQDAVEAWCVENKSILDALLQRDSDGPRMAETAPQARGEAGPAQAEGIAQTKPPRF